MAEDGGYMDCDGYLDCQDGYLDTPEEAYMVDNHGYLVNEEADAFVKSTEPSSLDALDDCPSYGAYGLDADESDSLASFETQSTKSSLQEMESDDESSDSEDGKDGSLRDSLPLQDESIKLKDWNCEFQEILSGPDCREKYQALHDLGHDFVYAAKTYGKIIISELHMPEDEKTIRSFNAGGIAGGEKYLCQGVFFKMVTDVLLSEPNEKAFWMYGGDQRNDAAAIKAAGLDLQGLINFYNVAESEDVHFPLMALIDYHGYRIIAMSILPLKRGTLIYGSSDGGKTCYAKNRQFNEMMLNLGSKLNLKSHTVKERRMAACGDIEGHLALDNKFYLLDFARVFPPEAPPRPASQQTGRLIFYQHLRPEFVHSYRIPLSSDAFSNFGSGDRRAREFNGRVRQATEYLYNTTIPEFAAKFDAAAGTDDGISSVTEELHRNGINVRHCGRVRSYCQGTAPRLMLFTEMAARVLKEMVNNHLRSVTEESRVPLKIPYRMAVVTFLNKLIGWDSASGESVATEFWTSTIKAAVQEKFLQCLSEEESKPSYDLRDSLLPAMLFQRFQQLTAIVISNQMLKELEGLVNLRELQLVVNPGDISAVGAKVKHLNVIDEAEAKMLYYEAMKTSGSRGRQLWSKINSRFEAALSSNTFSYRTLVDWAASLLEESRLQLNPQTALQTLKLASMKAQTALKISENYVRGMFVAAEILLQEGVRSAEGSVMQDRIFHSAIVSFIKVMKAETKYYTILLNTARSIFRKALSNQFALPSQKRTSLLTAATMFRALISVSASFSPSILYEYSIVMFEYIVEASQEDHYSSHLECAALATGQALHSYFLHSRKHLLEDERYLYSIDNEKSDFKENRFHVVIDSKTSQRQSSTYDCSYSPLSNLPLWIVQCCVEGEPWTEGELYEQLRNLLSIMPYCSSFPAEEIIAVFKYEPVDSFILGQISFNSAGIEESSLPQQIEVYVISGISDHPDLCADIRTNKVTPTVTITFGDNNEIDIEPVPGNYIALRLVPRDGSSQMTLQNITFKGKHVLKTKSKKPASLAAAMLELSRKQKDSPSQDDEAPLEYRLLQRTLEKQGYYLATLMQMTMVCPILRALTDAHLRQTSGGGGKVLTVVGSSDDLRNPVREDIAAFQENKEYGSINISHCGSVSDDVVKALVHPGLMSLNLTDDSSVTDNAIRFIAHNSSALRVLNLDGCTQLTCASMEELVQHCQCLMELNVWESALSDSLELISGFKKLQKLSLSRCASVTSRNIQQIATECTLLEELDLSEVEVTTEDIKKLATVPNLHSLTLNRCSKANDAVLKHLHTFPRLRDLSLEDGRMSDEPLIRLVMAKGEGLRSLLLGRCSSITNTLVTTVAQYCPELQKFSVAENSQIDDNSLVYLAINCENLKVLNASRTGVTGITLQVLSKSCPALESLYLDDCKNINNASLDVLQHIPALTTLSVQRNHLITQSAILKLIYKLENLQSLDVSDCPHFNENSVIKAQTMRPELKLTYSLLDYGGQNLGRTSHPAFVRESSLTHSSSPRKSRRGPSSIRFSRT